MTASDAEVASYFDAHKDDFKIPEKRKIRYLLIDVDAMRAKVVVPPADIERAYNSNIEQYSTPEQVRASHILLKTEGKDDAAVKAKAEDVLKQAKAGADFAELAKKNSEDEAEREERRRPRLLRPRPHGAGVRSGRRSRCSRGRSAISSRRSTATTSSSWWTRKPATTRPLAEVRQQLTDQLAYERAQAQAADLAQKLEKQISKPADLDKVAKAQGLTVQESGFFARDEPILGLGPSPEAADTRVRHEAGRGRRPAARVARLRVRDARRRSRIPYVPKLDEVKDRVRDEVDQAEGARAEHSRRPRSWPRS